MRNRGRKLPRQARPVNSSLRRSAECWSFLEQREGPESGICILEPCIIAIDISNAARVHVVRHALCVHFRDVIDLMLFEWLTAEQCSLLAQGPTCASYAGRQVISEATSADGFTSRTEPRQSRNTARDTCATTGYENLMASSTSQCHSTTCRVRPDEATWWEMLRRGSKLWKAEYVSYIIIQYL